MGENHVIGIFKQIQITLFDGGFGVQFIFDDLGLLVNPAAQQDNPAEGCQNDSAEMAMASKSLGNVHHGGCFNTATSSGERSSRRKDAARQSCP